MIGRRRDAPDPAPREPLVPQPYRPMGRAEVESVVIDLGVAYARATGRRFPAGPPEVVRSRCGTGYDLRVPAQCLQDLLGLFGGKAR